MTRLTLALVLLAVLVSATSCGKRFDPSAGVAVRTVRLAPDIDLPEKASVEDHGLAALGLIGLVANEVHEDIAKISPGGEEALATGSLAPQKSTRVSSFGAVQPPDLVASTTRHGDAQEPTPSGASLGRLRPPTHPSPIPRPSHTRGQNGAGSPWPCRHSPLVGLETALAEPGRPSPGP